jgi:methylmalonyl-CoA/ethylmalonyl-CoA epimerase
MVEKIEEQLIHASNLGIALIDAKPRKGAEGLDIAFLHPKATSGVLIELCEKKEMPSK